MDCPAICIRHEEDGTKCLLAELLPGEPQQVALRLTMLAAVRLAKELMSPQRDGGWTWVPVR